jgi:hypothetical protein
MLVLHGLRALIDREIQFHTANGVFSMRHLITAKELSQVDGIVLCNQRFQECAGSSRAPNRARTTGLPTAGGLVKI